MCFHETNPQTGHHLGGDAIEFYRQLKGLSFKEAVREMAEQYGVTGLSFWYNETRSSTHSIQQPLFLTARLVL